jgi:small subunit ribosomal protein S7
MWILDSVSKKKSRGSGKGMFAERVAEEIVSIVEGKSAIWERRNAVHKLAISSRANIGVKPRKRRALK